MNLRRWLTPGIGVKRWLLVVFAGLLLVALAFAHLLRQATRDLAPGGMVGTVLDALTLQFLHEIELEVGASGDFENLEQRHQRNVMVFGFVGGDEMADLVE